VETLSTYSLRKPLPSCAVDQPLLADIEAYILRRWEEINEGGKGVRQYAFSITDPIGTEKMATVRDYKFRLFSDDIKEVAFSLGANPGIQINFGVVRSACNISITVEGPNARELANGILTGILDLIRAFRTLNWVFAPDAYHPAALLLIFFSGLSIAVVAPMLLATDVFKVGQASALAGMFGTPLLIMFMLAYTVRIRPYTTFETRLNQRRAHAWKWLIGVLISGIAISLVAAAISHAIWK